MNGEIRPLMRSVNSEESQRDKPDPIQVAINVSQKFTADLCAGIRADRSQHMIFLRPWYLGVDAVDAAAGGKYKLRDRPLLRQFQKILRAGDIDLLIEKRSLNRRQHTRFGCQMNNYVEVSFKAAAQRIQRANVCLNQTEPRV